MLDATGYGASNIPEREGYYELRSPSLEVNNIKPDAGSE
jgi:hypothetical protein